MPSDNASRKNQRVNKYSDIGLRGRKTGLTVKKNVKKDRDGFDDMDDFFKQADSSDGTPHGTPQGISQKLTPQLTPQLSSPSSSRPRTRSLSPTQQRQQRKEEEEQREAEESKQESIQDGLDVTVSEEVPMDIVEELQEEEEDPKAPSDKVERNPKAPSDKVERSPKAPSDKVERNPKAPSGKVERNPKTPSGKVERNPKTPSDKVERSLRRSHRNRMAPLKFWVNEKVVYGRPPPGGTPVPVIKDVIRIDDEEDQAEGNDGGRKRKRGNTGRSRKETRIEDMEEEVTNGEAEVINWGEEGEVHTRQVIFLPSMFNPKKAGEYDYKFQKSFSEGEFMSTGTLVLPKGIEKPSKNTKDSIMVFYVLKGSVKVTIHQTTFAIPTGGQFCVPRGNQYRIVNETQNEVRLFFMQAREVEREEVYC